MPLMGTTTKFEVCQKKNENAGAFQDRLTLLQKEDKTNSSKVPIFSPERICLKDLQGDEIRVHYPSPFGVHRGLRWTN